MMKGRLGGQTKRRTLSDGPYSDRCAAAAAAPSVRRTADGDVRGGKLPGSRTRRESRLRPGKTEVGESPMAATGTGRWTYHDVGPSGVAGSCHPHDSISATLHAVRRLEDDYPYSWQS